MKFSLTGLVLGCLSLGAYAQVWKTLPKGVRIVGYRNVTTSKIESNFNQFRSESAIGPTFQINANTLNSIAGNALTPGVDINAGAYEKLVVGDYAVDASAQAQVHGTGFGYGLTDNIMLYGEVAYYQSQVKATVRQTRGSNYEEVAAIIYKANPTWTEALIAENVRNLQNVTPETIQSVVTDYFGYQPVGDWYGSGYGDMETGVMAKVLERNTWGVLVYPGLILPTGRQDDPDMLQDMGFGDGQFDLFTEVGTGYIFNDHLTVGTTFRYTYQAPTTKTLRVPAERDFPLSKQKGSFDVKYGDKINWMANSSVSVNDWLSFSTVYRFMYQLPSQYDSKFGVANDYLEYNSDKMEHQVQFTTGFSSITPFLKKQFLLPAQINFNYVQVVAGKNVPKLSRYELEFRLIF